MTTENPGAKAGETQPDPTKAGENPPAGGERKPSDEEAKLIKEVMKLKADLKKKEAAETAAEEKRLKDQGQYKELAEKAEARAKSAQDAIKRARVEVFAARAGINDPDDIPQKLIDGLEVDDAGNVTGAAEAIEALKTSKPYLFGGTAQPGPKPTTTPKPSGTPAGGGGPATFSEWEKMPAQDRYQWAQKNAQAYEALCAAHKAAMGRR